MSVVDPRPIQILPQYVKVSDNMTALSSAYRSLRPKSLACTEKSKPNKAQFSSLVLYLKLWGVLCGNCATMSMSMSLYTIKRWSLQDASGKTDHPDIETSPRISGRWGIRVIMNSKIHFHNKIYNHTVLSHVSWTQLAILKSRRWIDITTNDNSVSHEGPQN